jgi:hypothetical protein
MLAMDDSRASRRLQRASAMQLNARTRIARGDGLRLCLAWLNGVENVLSLVKMRLNWYACALRILGSIKYKDERPRPQDSRDVR